jgi:hypothetical protein
VTTCFGTNSAGNPDLSSIKTVIKTYSTTGSFLLSGDELSSLNRSGFIAGYISASTSLYHWTSVTVKATVEI